MAPFWVAQQRGNEHLTPHLFSAHSSGDETSPISLAQNGEGKEEKLSACFCIQGTSPLPYYHIRESGPIIPFITQPFPPPRISNSAILIYFWGHLAACSPIREEIWFIRQHLGAVNPTTSF